MCRAILLSILFASLLLSSDDSRCAACHPAETASFRSSYMGRSLSTLASQSNGRIDHRHSASVINIDNENSQQLHKVTSKGLSAEYPVAYAVGAGKVGYSYLVALGEYLFQSPASYYSQPKAWDVTPGYEFENSLDFTHPITSGCVFCHAGNANLIAGSDNRFSKPALTPISCERCHGAVEAHLQKPVRGSIVNPSRLPPAVRDAVCEQCHLEGDVRILNPGKHWQDATPGQPLEQTFVTYLTRHEPREGIKAVSQVEQLSLSRCARESSGRLWCGTCHSPHSTAANSIHETTTACLSCHSQLFSDHKHAPVEECVSCHMPRLRPNNIAHAAITDHLIAVPAKTKTTTPQPGLALVSAWRSPAASLADRDLGLALFQLAVNNKDHAQSGRAYELLSQLPKRDPEVLAALGSILLERGFIPLAVALYQQALAQDPHNARYLFVLGSALGAQGKQEAAIENLRLSIQNDPSSPDPYRKLAEIYNKSGQVAQSRQILRDYLKFMPQNLEFRR